MVDEKKLTEEEVMEQVDLPEAPEEIYPSDKTKPFSVAMFKRWRGTLMGNMNSVMQAFQKDVVGGQVRLNLAWNAMNAVIRALVNKGLIDQEDIRKAGAELMEEHNENIRRAKERAQQGATASVLQTALIQTPIEEIRDTVNAEVVKSRKS